MRICFSGFERPIEIDNSAITVLEINPQVLFCRVCVSISSEAGDDAIEPYSLWSNDGSELKASGQMVYIGDPLHLPWDHRMLAGALAGRMERLLLEDESARQDVEHAFSALSVKVSSLALRLDSDYSFGVDWDLKKYLKSFSFGVDLSPNEPLIDKLIKFLMLAKDVGLRKPIVFVNLKLFLSKTELMTFYEQVFFSKISVMLIENVPSGPCEEYEKKYTIDQDLLEHYPRV